MNNEKFLIISVVPTAEFDTTKEIALKLENDLPMVILRYHSIQSLLSIINPASFTHTPDFFVIDATVNNIPNCTWFEILQALKTITQVFQFSPIPKIVVMIDETISVDIIKSIKSYPSVYCLVPKHGKLFKYEDIKSSWESILAGEPIFPPCISKLIKTERVKKVLSSNEIELTPRQAQVLNLIKTTGASNKVISRTLKISESAVKSHVGGLLKKYRLNRRTQLATLIKT